MNEEKKVSQNALAAISYVCVKMGEERAAQ